MNFKHPYSFIFVLLLALAANNVHQWQPHAHDVACEVCLLASHDGIVPSEIEIHIRLAELAVHNWQHVESHHLIEGALIEPIRGSPLNIS